LKLKKKKNGIFYYIAASTAKNPLIEASKKGKRICKKKKKLAGCQTSEFGCCFDDKTPAKGPFSAGIFKQKTLI